MKRVAVIFLLFVQQASAQQSRHIAADLSVGYSNGFEGHVGAALLKVKGGKGSYTYLLNKYSTGLSVAEPGRIGHYLEASGTVYILQYGARFSHYFNPSWRAWLTPYVGVSYFGKMSCVIGYSYSSFSSDENRMYAGVNYLISPNQFFRGRDVSVNKSE